MHEGQLVRRLIQSVRRQAKEKGAIGIQSIKVRLGGHHWLDPEAFQILFEQMSAGTSCQGADLTIVEQPPRAVCRSCSFDFLPLDHKPFCPRCKALNVEIRAAPDLEVLEVKFVIPKKQLSREKSAPV